MIMNYIGIDPGSNGAIACVGEEVKFINFKGAKLEQVSDFLESNPGRVYIERVHSMPGQGVVSSFTFGSNVGVIIGILACLKRPYTLVNPTSWMKSYGMTRDRGETKTQWKQRLVAKAKELFPGAKITLANADALLIANYGKHAGE